MSTNQEALKAIADQRDQARQDIIRLASERCGLTGDSIRQLATVLAESGFRKFEITDE